MFKSERLTVHPSPKGEIIQRFRLKYNLFFIKNTNNNKVDHIHLSVVMKRFCSLENNVATIYDE